VVGVAQVVTDELGNGEHSKTSVLKFLSLALEQSFRVHGFSDLSDFEVSVLASVLNVSNSSDHLDPSEEGNGLDGGKTVRDIGELGSEGDFTTPLVSLRGDVSENSELSNTSVLQFGSTELVELLLANVLGKAKRIEVSSGLENTGFALERLQGSALSSVLDRGESGGGGNKGGNDGELHGELYVGNKLNVWTRAAEVGKLLLPSHLRQIHGQPHSLAGVFRLAVKGMLSQRWLLGDASMTYLPND